jgi:four helix bundle protein
VLNIAEAYGRQGAARQNHLRIALGSAAETCAGLDLVAGTDDIGATCRRVGAMLSKMVR